MTGYGTSRYVDDGEHVIGFERGTAKAHAEACDCRTCVEHRAAQEAPTSERGA